MVRVAHRRHHLALNIILTDRALGAERLLVVGNAIIVVVFCEEAADGQRFVALDALKAAFVEVLVCHPQNLAGTLFLALGAVDFRFTC